MNLFSRLSGRQGFSIRKKNWNADDTDCKDFQGFHELFIRVFVANFFLFFIRLAREAKPNET